TSIWSNASAVASAAAAARWYFRHSAYPRSAIDVNTRMIAARTTVTRSLIRPPPRGLRVRPAGEVTLPGSVNGEPVGHKGPHSPRPFAGVERSEDPLTRNAPHEVRGVPTSPPHGGGEVGHTPIARSRVRRRASRLVASALPLCSTR